MVPGSRWRYRRGGTVRSLCDRLSAGPQGAASARTAPPRPPL